MKKVLLIMMLGLMFGQSRAIIKSEPIKNNPCNDERFTKLRNTDLNNMSESDYIYYIKKEQECSEFMNDENNSSDIKRVGGFFISLGAGALLLNVNDDCDNCNESQIEDFRDKQKNFNNLGYGLIMIGGILISIGI